MAKVIHMNTELRKKVKIGFENDLFKLMNNALLSTTMENKKNHRSYKLIATKARRKYLVSEPCKQIF